MGKEMTKYLKIMADFDSTGLWTEGNEMLQLSEIPDLPFWFPKELIRWREKFEDYDLDMVGAENDFPLEEFADEGKILAKKLANALPDYEIWYFDEFAFDKHCSGGFDCDNKQFTSVEDLFQDLNRESSDYCYRIEHD